MGNGRMTEPVAYAVAQVWRDADYLHKQGYTDAAAALSERAAGQWVASDASDLCYGCGRPTAAPATVEHQPWCAGVGGRRAEERELEKLRMLWEEPDPPAIFGEPGTRDRGAA